MVALYTDWRHTRVLGAPPEAGAPYLGDAKKLLGMVFEQAAFNGLGVHKLERRLTDGTVIIAEKHGEIPRITIIPAPRPPGQEPSAALADFVVWARTTALPAGIDAEHPQQILQPSWRTFFYNADTAGHDAFPGDKGTYAAMFPQGVPLAGNIDWRSRLGERVSWYGPSARYWYDDFRQPRPQYGKHIFNLGRVVLDVDAYCTDSDVDLAERYVLGACMVPGSLYVVMADLPEQVLWPTPPTGAIDGPDAWATPSYPIVGIPLVLRRFTLATNPALPGPSKYVVPANSHTDLWTATVDRAASPWHFDEAGRVAVSHIPPASAQMFERGAGVVMPSTSHLRIELTIQDDDTVDRVDTAVSLAGSAPAAIAEDGGKVLQVVRKTIGADPNALAYRYGEHDYTALRSDPGPDYRYDRRQIIWADLRDGTLLLWSDSIVLAGGEWHYTAALLECRDGVESVLWTDGNIASTFGSGDAIALTLSRLAAATVAPLALAHLNVFGVLTGGGGGVHNAQCSLLHAHYFLPFRKADTYGQDVFAFEAGSWTNGQFKVDVARDIGANTQTDSLGHTTLPGFATYEGVSVFSYPMNAGINGRRIVLAHATGSTLAALTGIAGTDTVEGGQTGNDARYHPIWLLGKPPIGATV